MQDLKVQDIMQTSVITAQAGMSADELASFLADNEISGAPVVDGSGKLVGLVSLRDLAKIKRGEAVRGDHGDPSAYLRGWEEYFNPEDLHVLRVENGNVTVRDLMSPAIHIVAEEDSVASCARTMLDGPFHRLLVARGDSLVGIVTTFDILQVVADA